MATPERSPAEAARQGGALALAQALLASRCDTLATFAAYEAALPGLRVPPRRELNPPLWELGHIGWFQSHWIARNPQRALGLRADPQAVRTPARRANADALYDSTRVPHETRWALALPDARATRADLAEQLDRTLELLAASGPVDDSALYFFRLALLHEDMHHEAALYMAQSLDVPLRDPRWQCPVLPDPPPPIALAGGPWVMGIAPPTGQDADQGEIRGFFFDNECGQQPVTLAPTQIDAQVVRWHDYLPFIEDAGYTTPAWWSDQGWQWLERQGGLVAPRYLRRDAGAWWQRRTGHWQLLDLREPAGHLTWHEANAWCRWAGRRLPSEAEWECAALTAGPAFRWGDAWEWTASAFAPFPGFEPHPYREYSAPWFDGRPVLRGASYMTQPRMRHGRYRNFFESNRNDVHAGFRTCAP